MPSGLTRKIRLYKHKSEKILRLDFSRITEGFGCPRAASELCPRNRIIFPQCAGVTTQELPRKQDSDNHCSREELNLHGFPHTVLSRTRLPFRHVSALKRSGSKLLRPARDASAMNV
jgi:hypothetical protein